MLDISEIIKHVRLLCIYILKLFSKYLKVFLISQHTLDLKKKSNATFNPLKVGTGEGLLWAGSREAWLRAL